MGMIAGVLAGLVGTGAMTLAMYVGPVIGLPKMDIGAILGTLVTARRRTARILGLVIHFALGGLFGWIHTRLWAKTLGRPTWVGGLLSGAGHGLIAVGMMSAGFVLHPRPPQRMTPALAVQYFLDHLVFGLVAAITHTALWARRR